VIHYLKLSDPRWSAFVESCPAALPFHQPAWAYLVAQCYGYRPFVLAVTDKDGTIQAGIPVLEFGNRLIGRRWISQPFADHSPILTRQWPPHELVEALVREVRDKPLNAFELHACLPEAPQIYTHVDAVHHTLALSHDPHDVRSQFSRMHQGNIRRAERSEIQLRFGHSAHDLEIFYHLHVATRRRIGVPVQPWRFFRLLARHFIQPGMGFVLSAYVNGTPAAAGVFLTWNDVILYKYSASDPRFWDWRPNNLLTWAAIRWACDHGFHTMDWGRTAIQNEGLRHFKDGWGAREAPLVYSIVALRPPRPSSYRLLGASQILLRHAPPWVCRLAGEILYKYAA
jgi:CelD/BcsL family acetyltransferase involved in cellulose biosynthesis